MYYCSWSNSHSSLRCYQSTHDGAGNHSARSGQGCDSQSSGSQHPGQNQGADHLGHCQDHLCEGWTERLLPRICRVSVHLCTQLCLLVDILQFIPGDRSSRVPGLGSSHPGPVRCCGHVRSENNYCFHVRLIQKP